MTLPLLTSLKHMQLHRRFAALALVLLVGVQITYAGHQFDHATSNLADACSACLLLEEFDNCVAVAVVPASGHAIPTAVHAGVAPDRVNTAHAGFAARAPPRR
jgi:hypothetical protein